MAAGEMNRFAGGVQPEQLLQMQRIIRREERQSTQMKRFAGGGQPQQLLQRIIRREERWSTRLAPAVFHPNRLRPPEYGTNIEAFFRQIFDDPGKFSSECWQFPLQPVLNVLEDWDTPSL